MEIIIQNLQKKTLLDLKIINRAKRKLEKFKEFKNAVISVILVSDGCIKKLNKDYCKKNFPTDVLTFGYPKGAIGDIVVSVETAKRNSKIYNKKLEEEVILYIIHGILHLHNYDDITKAKARVMQKRQEEILKWLL